MSTQKQAFMKTLTAQTAVPLATVVSVLLIVINVVRGVDAKDHARDLELANLRNRVEVTESKVQLLSEESKVNSARWQQVREDLAAIKARLGVIDSRNKGE